MLDLGSGGGIDVLLSAQRVGASGFAYGLDMTDEMLDLARANVAKAGVTNVEFLRGYIEEIPLAEAAVDVVISNCVINLSTDKPAVLSEMFRVLRPGGRVGRVRRRRRGPPLGDGPGRARLVRRLHRRCALAQPSTSRAWLRPASSTPAWSSPTRWHPGCTARSCGRPSRVAPAEG